MQSLDEAHAVLQVPLDELHTYGEQSCTPLSMQAPVPLPVPARWELEPVGQPAATHQVPAR